MPDKWYSARDRLAASFCSEDLTQNNGLKPMKSIYRAFEMLKIVPVVLNVLTT